jgi:hypothetical protein
MKAALVVAFVFALAGTLAGCGSAPGPSTKESPPAFSPAPRASGRSGGVSLSHRLRSHETQHRGVSLTRTRSAQAEQ